MRAIAVTILGGLILATPASAGPATPTEFSWQLSACRTLTLDFQAAAVELFVFTAIGREHGCGVETVGVGGVAFSDELGAIILHLYRETNAGVRSPLFLRVDPETRLGTWEEG